MQTDCIPKGATPARRRLPPLMAFHGTSAPANGVIGPVEVAVAADAAYTAWDRGT
jgi:hypothetical protein